MKPVYLLFAFFLFSLNTHAQGELPVLMMEVGKGLKVAQNAQSKWLKVKTPRVVSTNDRLKLGGKTRVKLYCNGTLKTLEGKGEYNLNEIFKAEKQADLTEWQTQFHHFLFAANGSGKTFAKKLPTDQSPIKAISPVAGKLATFEIRLYWRADEDITDLKLEMTDADNKMMHTTEVSGGEAVIDPRKNRMFPGRTYSWRVFSASQPDLSSEKKTFQMNTLGQKRQVLSAMKEETSYKEASAFIQSLMEAAWFESREWYFDADQSYRKLLKKAPENVLYQQFYQAFLQRCGIN